MRCLLSHLDQTVVNRFDLWMVGLKDSEKDLEPEAVGSASEDGGEDGVDTIVLHFGLHLGKKLPLGLEDVWLDAGKLEEVEDKAGDALFDRFEIAAHVGAEKAPLLAVVWLFEQEAVELLCHERGDTAQHREKEVVFGGEVVDEATLADAGLFGNFVEGKAANPVLLQYVLGGVEDGVVGEFRFFWHKNRLVGRTISRYRLVGRFVKSLELYCAALMARKARRSHSRSGFHEPHRASLPSCLPQPKLRNRAR